MPEWGSGDLCHSKLVFIELLDIELAFARSNFFSYEFEKISRTEEMIEHFPICSTKTIRRRRRRAAAAAPPGPPSTPYASDICARRTPAAAASAPRNLAKCPFHHTGESFFSGRAEFFFVIDRDSSAGFRHTKQVTKNKRAPPPARFDSRARTSTPAHSSTNDQMSPWDRRLKRSKTCRKFVTL